MRTRIHTITVDVKRWTDLRKQLDLHGPLHVLFLASDHPAPVELVTDFSKDSPPRVLLPRNELAEELSRLPVDCPLYLRLKPRHTPQTISADQTAPSAATDGFAVHDLPALRIWAGGGAGAGTAALRVWGFNGEVWAPLLGPVPVPVEGFTTDVPLDGVLRVAHQLTGVSGNVKLRYACSGTDDDSANVTLQTWV